MLSFILHTLQSDITGVPNLQHSAGTSVCRFSWSRHILSGCDPPDGKVCSDVMQLCPCYVIPDVGGDVTSSSPWTQILASLTFHNCGHTGKGAGRAREPLWPLPFTQDPFSTYSFWPGAWVGGTQHLLRLHNANLGHLRHVLMPYLF